MKRLGDAELEIMLTIWHAPGPVQSGYVQHQMQGRRSWTLPAVITALNRLIDKGFLASEKQGRNNLYRPLISEQDYKAAEGRGIIDRLYGSSFTGMVAALFDGRAIDKNDLNELRKYLDELEGK